MHNEVAHVKAHDRQSTKLVPAVDKAVAVLNAVVQAKRALTLGEISRSLQLSKSTTHGLCHTLVTHGFLRKEPSGFIIGKAVMPLANAFLESTSIPRVFGAVWEDLESRPKETVVLSMLTDSEVLYTAARNVARLPTLLFTEGLQMPAHLCASGKAMLAWKPEQEIIDMYSVKSIVKRTSAGPCNVGQLLADLRNVRASGYSVDQGCVCDDIVGFGAAVFDSSATAVAGVGIVLRKSAARYAPDGYPRLVRQIAQRVTCRLEGRVPDCA